MRPKLYALDDVVLMIKLPLPRPGAVDWPRLCGLRSARYVPHLRKMLIFYGLLTL